LYTRAVLQNLHFQIWECWSLGFLHKFSHKAGQRLILATYFPQQYSNWYPIQLCVWLCAYWWCCKDPQMTHKCWSSTVPYLTDSGLMFVVKRI
jgi:hypothetical protein